MELTELLLTAITMLWGEEGKDYSLYENDETWWTLRLRISRN